MANKLANNPTALTKCTFPLDFDYPEVGPSIENVAGTLTFIGPFLFSGVVTTDDDVDVGADVSAVNAVLSGILDVKGKITGTTQELTDTFTGVDMVLTGDLEAVNGSFSSDVIVSGDVGANTVTVEKDIYGAGGDIEAEGLITTLEGFALNADQDTKITGTDTTLLFYVNDTLVLTMEEDTFTRSVSAGELQALNTNYYEAVSHNGITFQAARGTSGTPDYLDDGDTLAYLDVKARDGSGTWASGIKVAVEAIENHASGTTASELVMYASPERAAAANTLQRVAAFGSYDLLTAYDLPALDCSLFYPRTKGAGWLFGYIGDLAGLSDFTGLVMISDSTGFVPFMLGADPYIHFGDGSYNALADDTWRVGGDGSFNLSFEQYDDGGASWDAHFRVSENGAEVNSDEAFYLGDPATDGSWRIIRDSNNLVMQRRESSTWTTKDTITP